MEKYESDKTFIARWVAGELSEEEASEFEKSEAFKDFNRINEEIQKYKAPPIDKRQSLIATKTKITFGKQRKTNYRTWFAIAASIVVIFGLFTLFNSSKSYTTSFGEQLAVTLPDGSKIQLNADSKISHKRFLWLDNRSVSLQGEAYFEVEKGKGFEVITSHGNVTVLGTKFNVKTRSNTFELKCFEGVVRFDKIATSESHILKKNDQITSSENVVTNQNTKENIPSWMNGISTFKEKPLNEVLNEIRIQYNITFQTNEIDLSKVFTGSFVHDDLEKALKSTLTPMGVSYALSKDKTIVYLQ
ncbi:FecR family protein [Aquimarina sp. 2201CG1-2-11]|uniref:FecR family protein n=1 Tax=Aquimarina discodermiae TaxID=3231043 RepID=UPI00346382A7